MPLERRSGLGFLLGCDSTGGTTFVNIASIVDGLDGPSATSDDADVSILSDTYKEFRKGQTDPGEVTFMIAYDPKDSTSWLLAAMIGTLQNPPPNWQITYPDVGTGSDTETFRGYLKSMGRSIKKNELVQATITIKVSGSPGFSTS